MAHRRRLVEGDHVSTWASLKLCRAEEHFSDLFARVSQWNTSRVYRAPLRISDDRQHIEFLQPVGTRPPLDEWGPLFGDAVHNLRSALDCTIWEFAHLDGNIPRNPRLVSFPVLTDRSKWEDAASRLSSVPAEVLSRIEEVQPFNNPDPAAIDKSWLSIVSKLDNDDKHRGLVVGVPVVGQVAVEGMNLQLGGAIPGGQASFEMNHAPDQVADGGVFARFTFGNFIDPASTPASHAVVNITPATRYGDDPILVEEIYQHGTADIAQTLEYLRSGSYPEEETVIQSERFEPR